MIILQNTWNGIKNWFWRSETILFARLQLLGAAVWSVLSVTDLSPVLDPRWLTYWLIFSGALTEYLRKRNAIQSTVTVQETQKDGSTQPTTISSLQSPPPGP